MSRIPCRRAALALAVSLLCASLSAQAQPASPPLAEPESAPAKSLGMVTVSGPRPSSLPTHIPTTLEGVSREQIERTVNATDSEDALKYLPSLLVRKRYIGDYNHAILSSRASGTGNSARSAVYADGILLSNFLGNGVGALSYVPRWDMVTPHEIERVDVMYGPFSAAYSGNSVGAVVEYVTRMPTRFEAHAQVGTVVMPYTLYNTRETDRAWQASASVGNRVGDFAFWLDVTRTDSQGQPLTFATRLASSGVAGNAGTPVTGAVAGLNSANQPWFIVGTGTQYHTVQDHAKVKLAYDITPTVRASYTLGYWQNTSTNRPASYLRDAAGNPVYSGPVNLNGLAYTGSQALSGADFSLSNESLAHWMHGLSIKRHTRGVFDWEASISTYRYDRDTKRSTAAANALPGAASGGGGSLADGSGSGWINAALKGVWRPQGRANAPGSHAVDFGVQQERYTLRYLTSNLPTNWIGDAAGSVASNVQGHTRLTSAFAQDTWQWSERVKSVVGLRAERWQAFNGLTAFSATSSQAYPARSETYLSPKAALALQAREDVVVKASLGRAVRMPTVSELYGATSTTNSQYINDPNLQPEKSLTGELSVERLWAREGAARLTLFAEDTRDALYSQTVYDANALKNISRVQNVGRIGTQGLETAATLPELGVPGLTLKGSVTYARSTILSNAGFVTTPGDTVGKWQPNIPRWRATLLADYRFAPGWSAALGVRYSSTQYRTLNNGDVNGYAYMGVSPYTVADLRLRWQVSRQWSVAAGVDNLGNARYWNFHPYTQRSYHASVKFDL